MDKGTKRALDTTTTPDENPVLKKRQVVDDRFQMLVHTLSTWPRGIVSLLNEYIQSCLVLLSKPRSSFYDEVWQNWEQGWFAGHKIYVFVQMQCWTMNEDNGEAVWKCLLPGRILSINSDDYTLQVHMLRPSADWSRVVRWDSLSLEQDETKETRQAQSLCNQVLEAVHYRLEFQLTDPDSPTSDLLSFRCTSRLNLGYNQMKIASESKLVDFEIYIFEENASSGYLSRVYLPNQLPVVRQPPNQLPFWTTVDHPSHLAPDLSNQVTVTVIDDPTQPSVVLGQQATRLYQSIHSALSVQSSIDWLPLATLALRWNDFPKREHPLHTDPDLDYFYHHCRLNRAPLAYICPILGAYLTRCLESLLTLSLEL